MRGVDVGAHPQAGVGETHARRRGPFGQALDHRRGICRLDQLLQPKWLGFGQLGAQRQPRLDQRVVVVAGDEHELLARERSPELLEERLRRRERFARRAMAQLQHIAEQHRAIDVGEGAQQRLAQLGAAQQVRA